jgi:hypothetical protein
VGGLEGGWGGIINKIHGHLLLIGQDGGHWSAGCSPMLLLLVRRETAAAENFGEKRFVVVVVGDRLGGGQGLNVDVSGNWNHGHEGRLCGNKVGCIQCREQGLNI